MRSVQEVMDSKSLAVIGASQNPLKPGAMLIETLVQTGFQGPVAGINPDGGEIHGVKFYRAVDEIPFPVDLAVLLIPPKAVPKAVDDCARREVKGVVIASEGFAESGPEGSVYQEEVRRILKSTGMRGFGPNTLGLVNTRSGLTTSYFANENMLKPGHIGFASQSGIFIGALLRYLSSFPGLHISKGLGLGNKVDVDESEALEYLGQDDQTGIVGLYIEDVRDGRRFMEGIRRAARRKPVLILKGGRSAEGARAISSHTASLAMNDAVLDGALRQAGALRMENIEELLAALMGFGWMPLPKGNRLALVTYSGAQAVMSIDMGARLGVDLARFTGETRERLAQVIASEAKRQNPIDIFPDMMVHGFEKTGLEIIRALLDDKGVDGILFISFALFGPEIYQPLVEMIRENRTKPVFFSLLGTREDVRATRDYLLENLVPYYPFPETAVRVFSHMWSHARRRRSY